MENEVRKNVQVFNPTFRDEYELALRIGKKRFGSECKHEVIKNGYCQNCLRKVVTK
jgi:hypothetical protein